MPTHDDPNVSLGSRGTQLFLIVAIALAVVGYMVGITDGVPRSIATPPDAPPLGIGIGTDADADVRPAVTYLELRDEPRGPNRQWAADFARFIAVDQAPTAPRIIASSDKAASLALRSARRAYNGAPPVIPHRIDELSSAECMACHEATLQVGARRADRIPHPYLTNCTQCHVVAALTAFEPTLQVANGFAGLPAPSEGPRAWVGAPPMIPHATFMRDDCLSCHGPAGKPGLQTSHPERASCRQCHAPFAVLEGAILAGEAPFLPPLEIDQP